MTRLATTRGGREYTPEYLIAIDAEKCIGCGRCYKVCGWEVMTLTGVTEDGDVIEIDEDDDDFDEDDIVRKVMTIAHAENCIGCGSCNRVCPKDCQTHAAV